MSFRELAFTIRAVNRASDQFSRVGADAAAMGQSVRASSYMCYSSTGLATVRMQEFAESIRNASHAVIGFGALGNVFVGLAHECGLLDDAQARVAHSVMLIVTALGVFMSTSIGMAVAHKAYAAALWISTVAQTAFNISLGCALVLTGVGIVAVVAAAAAMMFLANATNAATSSVKNYNDEMAKTPSFSGGGNVVQSQRDYRRAGLEG